MLKRVQPYLIIAQVVISSVTLAKIIYPKEVFTCGVNTYNTTQIICIKE